MSTPTPTPPPKGTRNKQRQPKPQANGPQIEGRQLEPYFDDSVSGVELEPTTFNGRGKTKPKPSRKKPNQPSPHKPRMQPGGLNPPQSAERGYHSESGTAHYISSQGSRASSGPAVNGYPLGGVDGASVSQPLLPSNDHVVQKDKKHTASTPVKQAYAGPNFLASPAASSLPMPKAYAKAMPNVSSPTSTEAHIERRPQQDTTPSKPDSNIVTGSGREGSPLDFLFHADKAEKLRQASSSASPLSNNRAYNQASTSSQRRPQSENTLRAIRSAGSGEATSKATFLHEMNGTEGQSDTAESDDEPATSSYQRRMEALRNEREAPAPTKSQSETNHSPNDASTQALKRLLFDSHLRQAPQTMEPSSNPARGRKAVSVDIKGNSTLNHPSLASPFTLDSTAMPSQQPRPLPVRHPPATQQSATPAGPGSSAEIRMMEDNLRKYLNIGT